MFEEPENPPIFLEKNKEGKLADKKGNTYDERANLVSEKKNKYFEKAFALVKEQYPDAMPDDPLVGRYIKEFEQKEKTKQ
jgi:hypothetical protein